MSTRETLKKIASIMYANAAECHIAGMMWASKSARVNQFEVVGTDAEVEAFLALMVKDGLVDIGPDGQPIVNDTGEPRATVDIRITSAGGAS